MAMTASKNLHTKMFHALLEAPMRFFDTNPSGRVLNRFSKDMGAIDELLPRVLMDAIQILLVMSGILVMVIVANYYMIIAMVVVGTFFLKVRSWYVATAKDVKHLEGIIGQVSGSLVGLAISQSLILTGMLQFGMRQTAEVINQLTSVERVMQYTRLENENKPLAKGLSTPWPTKGLIEFKDLCLRYSESDPPVLRHLNLLITPGEKIGIVGRTGAGKSSLISALFRLAPLEGNILIDEVDTKEIELNLLRKHISIIPQEPVLFSATLRYNLDPFNEFDDKNLWEVLDEVELKENIESLDFMVSEGGSNFSLGQRQLLCLARAILRNNKILVLDEATANVDPRTDSLIQATIRRKFHDCTVLTIAHRLNTIMDSDKVLVMDSGRMILKLNKKSLNQTAIGQVVNLLSNDVTLCHVLLGSEILAEQVFAMAQFFNLLQLTMSIFYPMSISFGAEALVSIDRIQEFLMMEENRKSIIEVDFDKGVLLKKVNASWKPNQTLLRDITLNVAPGSLCAIVGPVGAVRNNILFGEKYSKKLYNKVVKKDFDQLQFADRTLVGERGTALSGGQRARINLARAVYRDADVYLLDDPLSAVDTHSFMLESEEVKSVHEEREEETGTTHKASPLMEYIVASGSFWRIFFVVLTLIISQVFCSGCDYWVTFWTQQEALRNNNVTINKTVNLANSENKYVYDGQVNESLVGLAISQSLILTGMLQYGIRQTAEVVNQLTSVERILQYTETEKEGPFLTAPENVPLPPWPNNGLIEIRNLYLQYSPSDPPVLKNLNIKIKPGQKIGIIGRTGAGKSSLITALFRLTEIKGDILIDGVNTKFLGLHDLRKNISIIPQEPVLFSATLRYNLDPFHEFNDEKLWKVLEEVELKENIANLDMIVAGGGKNFSVGQRQLLCLARAILRNSKILVLDEATANIDEKTDSLIQQTIRKKFKSCTVLTVAHRLNTIMDSDRVMVMDNGEIIEFDYPYELLQRPDTIFYKMVLETGLAMSLHLEEVALDAFLNRRLHD
ncbi:ABC tran, MMR HSR1 and/or AAA 21 domain containing protein [Asbolus verrucosus]|uniref:ABC tran, MMR HSR1 and/or AAA 21 domain containing protein n=1 Tax=Asbolus verrucosus TaxID=1661398 RepID=A0A482V1S6_ASBVE|nr:ABC tran, MMR HSR1 and/or AAA 21 domain containing protein [Asbolus verrucosus]